MCVGKVPSQDAFSSVEWICRNKTCTVLHQVGVSFDLYYDARKRKIKIKTICFKTYFSNFGSMIIVHICNCNLNSHHGYVLRESGTLICTHCKINTCFYISSAALSWQGSEMIWYSSLLGMSLLNERDKAGSRDPSIALVTRLRAGWTFHDSLEG